jgi:hypothetical protein
MAYEVQFLPPPIIPVINPDKLQANKTLFGLTDGADGSNYVYRELVQSEFGYMTQLGVFDQNDMKKALAVYDTFSKKELADNANNGYATKAQLQEIFVKLAELRVAQASLLTILQEPDPKLWAAAYSALAKKYQDYIEVAGGVTYPQKVNVCLEELGKPKLSDTLIKPIQRGTKVELLIFDLMKKDPSQQPVFDVFYQSAIGVNQSIQKGLVLRETRSERIQFESLIARYKEKPKAEILGAIIGDLNESTLTLEEWKSYFSQISVAKLSVKELQALKQLFKEKIEEYTERVETGTTQLVGLKGKELTTQENDNRKNKVKLDNIQAMSSFFTAKIEAEKPGKLQITPIAKNANVESIEPRVAKETFGDIVVDIPNQETKNRQAVKALLREGVSNVLKQGANANKGYHIVETKKGMGKTASFVVQDVNNVNLLQIVVMNGSVRIRELQSDAIDADSKIALMHSLATALNVTNSQPTVTSERVEKVRKLNELSVNAGQKIYVQKADGKKALYKQIEIDSAAFTFNKGVPAIQIDCKNNTPDQIKNKFQAVVSDGTFVPTLAYQQGIPAPMLNFKIDITTEAPLVAIKQYESALNAGMMPVFSSEAKRKVDVYVKKQMDNHNQDKQIAIPTASSPQLVTGTQVLERLKQASQDGLMVSLNLAAQQALRDHIAKGAQGLEYNVPLKHPYAAVMVNQLLEMGLAPDVNALSKANKMGELRQILKEDAKLNAGKIMFIDSGNIERDLITMQLSFEELGHSMEVNPKNIEQMLKHVKDHKLPMFDLKNISAKEHIACAQRLAQNGIFTKFNTEVPAGTSIFIRSRNMDHAKQMFEGYLNQGFLPVGNKRIKELSESALPIKIVSNDPKVIWERMNHCAQSGLVITLNDQQIKMMKAFCEKNNPQLPIHGYSWNTVKHNIELANQLGMGIRGVSDEAQAAYLRAQAEAKGNDMPRIDIVPIQKTESRFLRSDRLVNDRNKTKDFVNTLTQKGINISTSGLSLMKADIENQATKTKWFSKKPTAKAEEAANFLQTAFAHIEANVKSLASDYNKTPAANLRAVADNLDPPPVKKVKPALASPLVSPVPGLVRIPQPLPVARALPVVPAKTNHVANAAANVPAGQVPPAYVQPALTIQSILAQITEFQKDLKGKLDTGGIQSKEFIKISEQLYSVSSFLRQAEKDLAQGKDSAASNLPAYLESIKTKPEAHTIVKAFLTKLVEPQPAQESAPRSRY